MPLRSLVALLAALLLVVAACDTDTEPGDDDADAGAQSDDAPQEPEPVRLDDGVAATVDGDEINDEEVAEAAAELAQNPQAQAEIEQGLLPEELLPTLALEQVIQIHVFERGAADLGVEVTQADLDAAEEELVEQAGGREQFEEQVEQAGLSQDGLEDALRLEVLFDGVADELGADEEAAQEDAPAAPAPGQQAVQAWLLEQLRASDIEVDAQYGVWVAEQGTVMPPPELLPEQPGGVPEGLEGIDPEDIEDMDPEELEELLEEMGG